MNLVDTNILIYFFNKKLTKKQLELIFDENITISVINRIEFLSWSKIPDKLKNTFTEFKNTIHEFGLSEEIINTSINLRKHYKIKTPDAIIAATAIVNDLTLITRNTKDFSKIDDLKILNPFEL